MHMIGIHCNSLLPNTHFLKCFLHYTNNPISCLPDSVREGTLLLNQFFGNMRRRFQK